MEALALGCAIVNLMDHEVRMRDRQPYPDLLADSLPTFWTVLGVIGGAVLVGGFIG